jgi:hypothetical protein
MSASRLGVASVTIATTATPLSAVALETLCARLINTSGVTIYIGDASVSTTNYAKALLTATDWDLPSLANARVLQLWDLSKVYACVAASTQTLRVAYSVGI